MPTVPLDADQQRAVAHRGGACLVLAGPGSGKTRVIVERVQALADDGIPVARQLVLTYTVRAAEEMRSRAESALGGLGGAEPLVNFHAFGRRVLREWGWAIGVPAHYRHADRAQSWLHVAAVLEDLRPRTLWNPLRPHDMADTLLSLIGSAKQELVEPARYAEWAAARLATCTDPVEGALLERHTECAEVYRRLDVRFRERGVLDYDDEILLAERLLQEHEGARRAVCDGLDMVMVDEYQDTNLAQARLVEILTAVHGNILVVADDDQAIYKFRGASLANLRRFAERHPGHAEILLGTNYRSRASIVATCRALIEVAAAPTRRTKVVHPIRGPGPHVELWEAQDARSEAMAIARLCADRSAAGERLSDIAWLVRRHEDMAPAMLALQELGVPYRVHGGRGFFRQPEIKDLLAVLSAVDDPADSQAVLRCLHLPAWSVSPAGRLRLVALMRDDPTPLIDRLAAGAEALLPDAGDAAAATVCARDIRDLAAQALMADVREICFDAVERSGFLGIAALGRDVERAQAGANLGKIADLLESFAEWSTDVRLGPALQWLTVLRDSGAADEVAEASWPDDAVELLTAHGAKGLEWPVVIVSRCTERRWPGRPAGWSRLELPGDLVDEPAPEGDAHTDEERRLLYVACTRARDLLVLTWAQRYRDTLTEERLSPFVTALSTSDAAPVRRSVPWVAPAAQRRRPVATARAEVVPRPQVSDLRAFRECPRRYEYRARWHMPVRPSVQSWYGTLIHRVLERAGRLRCAGAEIDGDQLALLWHQAWSTAADGYRGAHAELERYGDGTLRDYAASPAWRDARLVAVEQPFTLPLDTTQVSGRFDRIDVPRDGIPTVVDYKTGPVRDEEGAARDLQVRAYAVALARQEGVDAVAVELHHLQTADVTRVNFDAAALRRAGGQMSAITGEIAAAWRERSFPAAPASWRCRRCDYRVVCDERREED